MWTTIISLALSALRFVLGVKTEPTVADKAAEAATAETQLAEEESANAVLETGAAARAAADAHSLPGSGSPAAVNLDPAAPVNTSPDAHFRRD